MSTAPKLHAFAGTDDAALVRHYLQGSQQAFEALLARHRSKMMASILQIVKDRDVAQDLYQEALIKLVNQLKNGQYNETGKFLPWALRVCRNQAIDSFRRGKRNPQVSATDNPLLLDHHYHSDENRERSMMREENKRLVRELIRELPAAQREVLIMRAYNGMSFKEIAELTDVSINTALGRMRYALANLRKLAEARGFTL